MSATDKRACSSCGVVYLLEEGFYRRYEDGRPGYHKQCKPCIQARKKERRMERLAQGFNEQTSRVCSDCKEILGIEDFPQRDGKPMGRICEPCRWIRKRGKVQEKRNRDTKCAWCGCDNNGGTMHLRPTPWGMMHTLCYEGKLELEERSR